MIICQSGSIRVRWVAGVVGWCGGGNRVVVAVVGWCGVGGGAIEELDNT